MNPLKIFLTLTLLCLFTGVRADEMTATPLTLEAVEAGTINIVNGSPISPIGQTIQYIKNGGGVTTTNTYPVSIAVAAGDVVQFFGNNPSYYGVSITSTNDVYVYGNVMSLIDATNYATARTLTGDSNFSGLFCAGWNGNDGNSPIPHFMDGYPTINTTIRNHPTKDIVLPAIQLTPFCYDRMFAGCTGLTRAPKLPATNLRLADGTYTDGVYAMMFICCTGLTEAPELPATVCGHNNYLGMFAGCTGLTAAPALPAMEMTSDLYAFMFADCTNLVTPPVLPATKMYSMCYNHMFAGCTSLTTAPDLNSWSLVSDCYWGMFEDCTSLTSVKCLAREFPIGNTATLEWMKGVPATGTFYKATGMDDWPTGEDGIPAGWTVADGGISDSDMGYAPMTFEALNDGTQVSITNPGGYTIEYKVNDGAWTESNANPIAISLNAGDKARFRGSNAKYCDEGMNATQFSCDKDCYVYGNVMSLVTPQPEDYAATTTLTGSYNFSYLFVAGDWGENTTIKNHPDLDIVLPATTLTDFCYNSMFYGCRGLTRTSALPATTLAAYCYNDMFSGCTGLKEKPTLPATTLTEGCYTFMFEGCTGITDIYGSLPATTLADMCYDGMFMNCTGLTNVYENLLPATTLANGCYSEMFMGCTGLATAPLLPATTLTEGCYNMMFNGCSSLNSVKCMATDVSADYCMFEWMDGVAATGTFIKASLANMTTGISGIPEGWTVNSGTMFDGDIYATPLCFEAIDDCTIVIDGGSKTLKLATMYVNPWMTSLNWGAEQSTNKSTLNLSAGQKYVFKGTNSSLEGVSITSTGDFYVYGNVMSVINGDDYMTLSELPSDNTFRRLFKDNAHVKSHPEKPIVLAASTLTDGCYYEMFSGCAAIDNIICLATDIEATDATTNWLSGVAATGTFVKQTAATAWAIDSPHGIPTGWTTKDLQFTPTGFDAQGSYLIMEPLADGTTVTIANPQRLRIYYTTTGNGYSSTNANPLVISSLAAGTKLRLMGNNAAYSDGTEANSTIISCDKECYVYGNVMSLVNRTDYATLTTLTANNTFAYLFKGNDKIKSKPNKQLLLPATTLTAGCYQQMFKGCAGLNAVKCLATDISAENCTTDWLDGVAATGTFEKAPEMTSWTRGPSGIPEGWVVDGEASQWMVTMPSSGVATFSVSENVTIPAGLTAYYCTTYDSASGVINIVALTGSVIPANTGVLLRGTAGEQYTLGANTSAAPAITDNVLVAVTTATHIEPTDGDKTNFMLKSGQFIKIAASDATSKMAANKAYLQIPTAALSSSAKAITIDWDGTVDGIERPTPEPLSLKRNEASVWYDLGGRKITPRPHGESRRGAYINNGKKVLVH